MVRFIHSRITDYQLVRETFLLPQNIVLVQPIDLNDGVRRTGAPPQSSACTWLTRLGR
ncbi:hypothetical protein [Egbenema bharatensis]|uniref:hypothetical protein n=1 Tax=Egbenema bharatensis TaxID=3463334 RepID=UPI003A8566C3